MLAEVELELGLAANAEATLMRALEIEETHTGALALMGRVRLRGLNDPVGALAPLQDAFQADPNDTDTVRDLAETSTQLGHDENARQYFVKLLDFADASREDYGQSINHLLRIGDYSAADEVLRRFNQRSGDDTAWFAKMAGAIAASAQRENSAEADTLARRALSSFDAGQRDEVALAEPLSLATLTFLSAGFQQSLVWLSEEVSRRGAALPARNIFQTLLALFLKREMPRLDAQQAKALLLGARDHEAAQLLRGDLDLVLALLGVIGNKGDTPPSHPRRGWRAFVEGPAPTPVKRPARGFNWRPVRPQTRHLEGEGAPERLAAMVRTVVRRAPRSWLHLDNLVHVMTSLTAEQGIAVARALAAADADLGVGDRLIVLTLAERILQILNDDGQTAREIRERIGKELLTVRVDAGIISPEDEEALRRIDDPGRQLRQTVGWLTKAGRRQEALDLLTNTAKQADPKLAVVAIECLADIQDPHDAYTLLAARRSGKLPPQFLTAQARLCAYLGDEQNAAKGLEAYLAVQERIGRVFRIGALLFLDRYDQAVAEAHMMQETDATASAVLPAIGSALLAGRLEDADRYLSLAIDRLQGELIDPSMAPRAVGRFLAVTRFFRTAQHEMLAAGGADLSSLGALEQMTLDLLDGSIQVDQKGQAVCLTASLLTATTLLQINHTARAEQLLTCVRRSANHSLSDLYRIADTYTNRRSSLDKRTASTARNTLGLVVAGGAEFLAQCDHQPAANEHTAGTLTYALHAAVRLGDTVQVDQLGTCAKAVLQTLSQDGTCAGKAAARLATTMVQYAVETDAALSYLKDAVQMNPSSADVLRALVTAYRYCGNFSGAEELGAHAGKVMPFVAAELSVPGADSDLRNRLLRCRAVLNPTSPAAVDRYIRDSKSIGTQKSWEAVAKVLNVRVPQTAPARGVIFIASYLDRISPGLAALPCSELQKDGVAVVPLFDSQLAIERTGDPGIDQFNGIIRDFEHLDGYPKHVRERFFEWDVRWDERQVMCLGMNFWQPLFEMTSRTFRTFRLDMSHPGARELVQQLITRLDRALFVCELIFDQLARPDFPIRFVSRNWQYPPVAAFRIYCQEKGWRKGMHFVAVGQGYESYYSNLNSRFGTTAVLLDLTTHRETRGPTFGTRERFEKWCARQDGAGFSEAVDKWIRMDRTGSGRELGPAAREVRDRVEAHRAAGKPVIGVFGKILYDLAVPYMGGPAHTDMADWLDHTVRTAAGSDTLVLVKPHPHEARPEIAERPREFFLDLIPDPIPDNVIPLGHRWFTTEDMIDMIDLGVLWNGTTGLELGANGIPVIMCDDWGPRDYPVGHPVPQNRAHYEEIIRNPSLVTMPEGHRARCAALLNYMATPEVMRPYPFLHCEITNAHVGPPVLNEIEVERFFRDGDEMVEQLAQEFNIGTTSAHGSLGNGEAGR